jgi:hypothetical protein
MSKKYKKMNTPLDFNSKNVSKQSIIYYNFDFKTGSVCFKIKINFAHFNRKK